MNINDLQLRWTQFLKQKSLCIFSLNSDAKEIVEEKYISEKNAA